MSTEPSDREAAEKAVYLAYELAKLEAPKQIYWVLSLREGVELAAKLLECSKANALREVIEGQFDAGWLAWTDAFNRLDPSLAQQAEGMRQLGKQVAWLWALDEATILVDRPIKIARDNLGELHCENGPAFQYRDGSGEYFWHGTRVPADLIEEGWSTQRILTEENAEVARCAVERIGWDKFVEETNAKLVSREPDPGNAPFELFLYDIPQRLYETPTRLLLCTNGTPERDGTRHRYGLTVPARFDSALAAAAWTHDETPEEYAQTERRT